MVNIGEAYAFLYYKGRTEDISKQLPVIREDFLTPSDLKLDLTGLDKYTTKDPALADIVQQAKDVRMSHVLKASRPNPKNKELVTNLRDILNGIYSMLHEGDEEFFGQIIYKEGNKYVFDDGNLFLELKNYGSSK